MMGVMCGGFFIEEKEFGMLVLSRKKNEAIILDNNIRIVVADIRGDKVRIGIEAPKEMSIHREEVQEEINKNAKT